MIVFNHNIHFVDEPGLSSSKHNPELETVQIARNLGAFMNCQWLDQTEWMEMSLQKCRYTAEKVFGECLGSCRWGLEIKGVVAITWCNGSGLIEYKPLVHFSPERLQFWVLHTLLPIMFTLRQQFEFLHVGSVEIAGKPVLFSAESFGGKSTMTDYFIGQGHKLLSDDSLAVYSENGSFYAVPAYPFHRPYRTPEDLGYPVTNMATDLKTVHAVYLLDKAGSDAAVTITEVTGIEKYKAFHFTSFITFDFFKQKRFNFFAEMAKVTPTFEVTVPWDMERLGEVHEAIVGHSEKLT